MWYSIIDYLDIFYHHNHGDGLGICYWNICLFFEKIKIKFLLKLKEYFFCEIGNIFRRFCRKTAKRIIEPIKNKGWKGER